MPRMKTDAILVVILDESHTKNTTVHLKIGPLEKLPLHQDLYFSAYFSINVSAMYYFFNGA